MDNLKDELSNIVSRVRNFTLSVLEGEPNKLYDAACTYIASGGKKLRPFMVIKSCEMFSGMEEKALPAAAAVELIWTDGLRWDCFPAGQSRLVAQRSALLMGAISALIGHRARAGATHIFQQ